MKRYLTRAKHLRWIAAMVVVAVSAALATPETASATEYPQNNTTAAGFRVMAGIGRAPGKRYRRLACPGLLDCPLVDYALTAVWVGLSGAADPEHCSDSWLPQVGTESRCTGNGRRYAAVWQLYKIGREVPPKNSFL